MRLRASLLIFLGACSQDPTLVTPPTFERPGDVAFVCFDTVARAYVPMVDCQGYDNGAERYSLTALVTQTASGEVGAVDLLADTVLDLDIRVPGYTFVRVGEVPSGIVVSETQPNVTYVSNYGSREVMWIETARFRQDASPVGVGDGSVGLPDGPTSLVLGPSGDVLFVALPRAGLIVPIPILPSRALEVPDMSSATVVDLVDPLPDPVTSPSASEYARLCLDGALPVPRATPREASSSTRSPRPEKLLVVDDQLLVTDSAQPLIHRFTIGAGGALTPEEPIVTSVPVRALAVTPIIPSTVGGDTASEPARVLYAIDAVDQTIIAIDFLEGSPTFGGVIPVNTGDGPADRIQLAADVRSIGVLTPGYPGAPCDVATSDATSVGPGNLRGVFLAVGLTSGLLQIIDVVDLDATCRGLRDADGACDSPFDDRDRIVSIERHRPRIGQLVDEGVTLAGTPTLSFEGSPGSIADDGQVTVEGDPDLAVLEACPRFLGRVYPNDDPTLRPLICASVDPWAIRAERWDATYAGEIPGARGVGQFSTDLDEITSTGPSLCARGVLGRDDVAASGLGADDPERGYGGDRVRIVSDPPTGRVDTNPDCEIFVLPEDGSGREEELVFLVTSASDGALRLAFDPAIDSGVYALARACFEQSLFEYQVEVGEAFAVIGSVTGFDHRVVSTPDGCRVDTAGQPVVVGDTTTYLNARAFDGRLFQNPYLAFQIQDADELVPGTRAELTVTLTGAPGRLFADIGERPRTTREAALVERIYFSPVDERLYVLDGNSDGFVQLSLNPFLADAVFE